MNDVLRDSDTECSRRAEAFWRPHVVSPSRRATDVDHLEQRVLVLERLINTHTLQLATPMDVTKLQFSTRTVVAVVVMCVALAAGQWGLNTRLEGNVKQMIDQNARIQDDRYASMQKTIDQLKNRVELSQIELTSFKENLLRDLGLRRIR